MDFIPRILGIISVALFAFGMTDTQQVSAPMQTSAPSTTVMKTGDVAFVEPTPTTVIEYSANAMCPQWWGLALQVGWQEADMDTLDYIMWRESRCDPTQHNTTLNKDGSTDVGLTQINDRSWCLPTRWYPNGYLQSIGVLTKVGCDELFDPETNLKAAKAIHDYSKQANQNGFQPWEL